MSQFDIYQRAFVHHDVDGSDLRWRVEHAQHLHPMDVPRFASSGGEFSDSHFVWLKGVWQIRGDSRCK